MVGIQESTCLAQSGMQAARQPNRGGNNDLSELSAILPGCFIISTIMNHDKCIVEPGKRIFRSDTKWPRVWLEREKCKDQIPVDPDLSSSSLLS